MCEFGCRQGCVSVDSIGWGRSDTRRAWERMVIVQGGV
ncbi:MAG: hypothetical protein H6P94_525 [Thermoplasmatales archaeon]|nr:hypothetical protein [Thermoplasmatales archaeon]